MRTKYGPSYLQKFIHSQENTKNNKIYKIHCTRHVKNLNNDLVNSTYTFLKKVYINTRIYTV